ncbi:MAG TPA: hypothetical protein VMV46_00560 [Thermoanaerobaculia bacterium]|nr:hypothetical protein [Thermoanaerobaculia bacterium]
MSTRPDAPLLTATRSVVRALPALAVGAMLALATAQPVAAEPDHRHRDRDEWRHRDHRSDHWKDRDRHRDRRDRRHWDRGRHDRRHWDRGRHGRPGDRRRDDRRFRAPQRIGSFSDYDRYHHGRVYHRAHRHHHQVYAFPVLVRDVVHYEPYAYCDGGFYQRGAFFYDGPRLSIRWSF